MGDNFDRIAWNRKVVMLTNFVVVNLLLLSAFGNSFGSAAQPKGLHIHTIVHSITLYKCTRPTSVQHIACHIYPTGV